METILIIDDSMFNVAYLAQLLGKEYNIISASNGTEGLAMAQNHLPSLILLDIEMPGLDGFQVVERLQHIKETQEIPVVFLTGIADAQIEERAFFSGAVDYIQKPFSGNVVCARVRTHINLFKYRKLLETQMYTDVLTDVYTRKHCMDYILKQWQICLRDKNYISIAIADIDFFKKVNDTFGHFEGDRVLRVVARTINDILQQHDGYIARMGGEEFVMILCGKAKDAAVEVMSGICSAVRGKEIYQGGDSSKNRIYVTISIGGITVIPNEEITSEQCEKIADKMLYSAKHKGRDRVEWMVKSDDDTWTSLAEGT